MSPVRPRAALLLGLLVLLAPVAAADPVEVDPTGDAEAELFAVSVLGSASTDSGTSVAVMGDATNDGCSDLSDGSPVNGVFVGGVHCIAVSVFGNARNDDPDTAHIGCSSDPFGDEEDQLHVLAVHCVAVSVFGNAHNEAHGYASCEGGYAVQAQCTAVSVMGDASNHNEGWIWHCMGGSVTVSCTAISVMGDASNEGGADVVCRNATLGTNCVAISVFGDATNAHGADELACRSALVGLTCVAVSVLGEAETTHDGCVPHFPTVGVVCDSFEVA